MRIHDLTEQRGIKLAEIRGLQQAATTANRDLTDQESARVDVLLGELEAINARLDQARRVDALERSAEARPASGTAESHELAELERRVRLAPFLEATLSGRPLSGAEAEFAQHHRSGRAGAVAVPVSLFLGSRENRTLSTTTPIGGPGSNLVQTNLGPMIDRLRPALLVETMGAIVANPPPGLYDVPQNTGGVSAYWVAEGSNTTASDPTFSKISMAPKTVSAEMGLTRRMGLHVREIEDFIRRDMGYGLAQALDSAAIKGGGTNEPTGIIGNGSVEVVAIGTNGGAQTVDLAADMIGAIDADNVPFSARGFLTNSKVRKAALKVKDGQSRPYGLAEMFKNERVEFSNQVPSNLTKGTSSGVCSALIYGAWSELIIAYWSAVDILANPYTDASSGGMRLHAFLDCDIALRHAESFVVCKDLTT